MRIFVKLTLEKACAKIRHIDLVEGRYHKRYLLGPKIINEFSQSKTAVIITCVALAKAGLVVGQLRSSVRPQQFWGVQLCNL